jgi:hypothetical protein
VVRQGGSGRSTVFYHLSPPRLRQRLDRPRQGSEGSRRAIAKVYPGFTVQGWLGIHWSDDPIFNAQYQRAVEGLRKAGVLEGEKKAN